MQDAIKVEKDCPSHYGRLSAEIAAYSPRAAFGQQATRDPGPRTLSNEADSENVAQLLASPVADGDHAKAVNWYFTRPIPEFDFKSAEDLVRQG